MLLVLWRSRLDLRPMILPALLGGLMMVLAGLWSSYGDEASLSEKLVLLGLFGLTLANMPETLRHLLRRRR